MQKRGIEVIKNRKFVASPDQEIIQASIKVFPHIGVKMNSSDALWMRRRIDIVSSTKLTPNPINDHVFVEKILTHAVSETIKSPSVHFANELKDHRFT